MEVGSRREEYTKHFALSDGNVLAVQYGIPIHFKGVDGHWTQHDNRIKNHGAAWGSNKYVHGIGIPDHSEQQGYSSSEKADKKKLVTISKGRYEISWGFADANKPAVE